MNFKGNANLGFFPLEEAMKYKQEGTYYCLNRCPRSFNLHHYGTFKGSLNSGVQFDSGEILTVSGSEVEVMLDVGRQLVRVRAISRRKVSLKTFKIQPEEDVVYCWAISAGMKGSGYEVVRAWAQWSDEVCP